MPQEFHVLRCYSCSVFQVHIVKKSNKWQCKVCNEKQSLKQVYGQGTGKDCRNHVQRLNTLRITAEQDSTAALYVETSTYSESGGIIPGSQLSVKQVAGENWCEENEVARPEIEQQVSGSKWGRFLAPKKERPISSDEEGDEARPIKKQKASLRGRQAGKHRQTSSHPRHGGWQSLGEAAEEPSVSPGALQAGTCREQPCATQPGRSIQADTETRKTTSKSLHKGKWGKYCVDDVKIQADFDDDSNTTNNKCVQEIYPSDLKVQREQSKISKGGSVINYSNRWSKYLVANGTEEDNAIGSQSQECDLLLTAGVTEPSSSSSDVRTKINNLDKKLNILFGTDDLSDEELDQLLQL